MDVNRANLVQSANAHKNRKAKQTSKLSRCLECVSVVSVCMCFHTIAKRRSGGECLSLFCVKIVGFGLAALESRCGMPFCIYVYIAKNKKINKE